MMEFGLPYLIETPSVEACCALAKELGLSFVELNANFPDCQTERLDPILLHRLSRTYGVYFTLHAEEDFDPFTFNQTVRAAWLKSFRRTLELAAALQMPIVNMHFPKGIHMTLPEQKVYLYEQYAEEFHTSLEAFRQMCEEALAGTATHIAIENTNGWMPHEQRAIEELLTSPVFGLTLDIGHCHGAQNADEPFFCRNEEKLMHMHGHDAQGKRDHLALGDGEINLQQRFAWAKERRARVVLETKTLDALRRSVTRLPEFLA